MQEFTRVGGRLRKFPLGARLVYSSFLLFTLLAVATTGWLGSDMLGPDLSGLSTYYAGGAEQGSAAPAPAETGGPQLDLPEGVEALAAEPMPLRKLLEVTHFHLFSMPVYLMVLSHLFMFVSWRDRAKWTWIALATLGVVGHLLAPWLVRAQWPLSAAIYAVSGALMALSFIVMSIVPLWQMWVARSPA